MSSRILVGVDGSAGSRRALRWAVAEAEARGAIVDALFVWESPYAYGEGLYMPADEKKVADAALQRLTEAVSEIASDYPDVEVHPVAASGRRGADPLCVVGRSAAPCPRSPRTRRVRGPSPRLGERQVRTTQQLSGGDRSEGLAGERGDPRSLTEAPARPTRRRRQPPRRRRAGREPTRCRRGGRPPRPGRGGRSAPSCRQRPRQPLPRPSHQMRARGLARGLCEDRKASHRSWASSARLPSGSAPSDLRLLPRYDARRNLGERLSTMR